jgi:hypothetical protein
VERKSKQASSATKGNFKTPGRQCQVRFKNPVQVLFLGGEISDDFIDLGYDGAK